MISCLDEYQQLQLKPEDSAPRGKTNLLIKSLTEEKKQPGEVDEKVSKNSLFILFSFETTKE
jgi:hypothetical protein